MIPESKTPQTLGGRAGSLTDELTHWGNVPRDGVFGLYLIIAINNNCLWGRDKDYAK